MGLERAKHAILIRRLEPRETGGASDQERAELLDEPEKAQEITTKPSRHARDVSIDEAWHVRLVCGHHTRHVRGADATTGMLHDEVLPRLECDEVDADRKLVATPTSDREQRCGGRNRAADGSRLEHSPASNAGRVVQFVAHEEGLTGNNSR